MKRNQLLFLGALLSGMLLLTGCGNEIEDSAVPVVNNIISEAGGSAKCTKVKITETLNDNTYRGEAVLDNGNKIPVAITVNDDQIFVVLINE